MYKGLPSSYSLLQGKVQNGPHFSKAKFRMDEVSRGPVEPFRVLVKQFRFPLEFMKLFTGKVELLRSVGCYDINGLWEKILAENPFLRSVQ